MPSKFKYIQEETGGEASGQHRLASASLVLFGATVFLSALDITTDLRQGTTLTHVAAEAAILALGLVGALAMLRHLARAWHSTRQAHAEAARLAARLSETHAEAARWRAEAEDFMRGLGAAIDEQFTRWGLTPAEAEVALLMLKGLAHKEIAQVRRVGEATVRQQAHAVYQKSGVAGKHELIAFFLEDLMLPQAKPPPPQEGQP